MFDRLFNISRAYINHHLRKKNNDSVKYDDFDSETGSNDTAGGKGYNYSSSSDSTATGTAKNTYGLPQQVVDDLALFGITPPGNWNEVIVARNREMKKYHPDKYMKAEEKVDAANEIAQIYNAAFERLKKHFNKS